MSDSILGLVRIWGHPFVHVLELYTKARTTLVCAAVINMYVSAHRRANKIAHHRCSVVIGRELASPQFKSRPIWTVNRPAGLRHRSMTSFVLLLMALVY
jgi:hypothetical protein